MSQAKGSKGQLLLDFETTFGENPASAAAYRIPFNDESLGATRALNQVRTIRGRRDPGAPFDGNLDVSGNLTLPMCARSLTYLLKAMFGAPSTSQVASTTLDAGSASDKGAGKVGLPCTAHGFKAGSQVKIAGTTNYNGVYSVDTSSTANEIVITETYAAETLDGTETVDPVIRVTLDAGAATDEGSGLVGLPCTSHGLPVGAYVTIAGTTNYNGAYSVERGTTVDKLLISETYASETFAGTETVDAAFYDHVFDVGDSMPSMVLEKGFTDIGRYHRFNGCKVGSWSFALGGDGELTQAFSVAGANEVASGASYDASYAQVSTRRFDIFEAELDEGGSDLANATEFSLDVDFGLDTGQYVIGGQGVRGDIPEGDVEISGRMTVLFENATLLNKALNGTESSLLATLSRTGSHYKLDVELNELRYERNTPTISGPQGVRAELPFIAYWDDHGDNNALIVTLRNDIKTYA